MNAFVACWVGRYGQQFLDFAREHATCLKELRIQLESTIIDERDERPSSWRFKLFRKPERLSSEQSKVACRDLPFQGPASEATMQHGQYKRVKK